MQTLEELNTEVTELKAEVEKEKEEHKTAMEEKEKEAKTATEEKEKEAKKAQEEKEKEKDKHEASYKSMHDKMHKAMDEEKDEKKKEGMKAALSAMEDEHKKEKEGDMDNPKEYERKGKGYKSEEEKEKEREHKAQITYLTAEVMKPKIKQLTQLYQASKTSENDIKSYSAEWEKQTPQQLDAEIIKMEKIIGQIPQSFEAERTPFGFSTSRTLRKPSQYDAAKVSDKVEKMSDSDLFNRPGVN